MNVACSCNSSVRLQRHLVLCLLLFLAVFKRLCNVAAAVAIVYWLLVVCFLSVIIIVVADCCCFHVAIVLSNAALKWSSKFWSLGMNKKYLFVQTFSNACVHIKLA